MLEKCRLTSRKGSPWHGKAVLPPGLIWAAHAAVHCVPHHPWSSPPLVLSTPAQQFASPSPRVGDNNGAHPRLRLPVLRKKCPPSPLAKAFPYFKRPLILEQQPLFPFPPHPDVTVINQQPRVPVYPMPSPIFPGPQMRAKVVLWKWPPTAWLSV